MTELTKDKLVKELKENNKSLREVAKQYDTNLSHVYNLKDEVGLQALKSVIEYNGQKQLTVSEVLKEIGQENTRYWGYHVEGNSLVIDFYDTKWKD